MTHDVYSNPRNIPKDQKLPPKPKPRRVPDELFPSKKEDYLDAMQHNLILHSGYDRNNLLRNSTVLRLPGNEAVHLNTIYGNEEVVTRVALVSECETSVEVMWFIPITLAPDLIFGSASVHEGYLFVMYHIRGNTSAIHLVNVDLNNGNYLVLT